MLKIEMESHIRNYLLRVLEQHKEKVLNDKKINPNYDLTQISIATDRLMGIKPTIALNKNEELINFGLTEE